MTHVGITTIQPRTSPIYAAFDERLRELGYIEGQNLVVDLLNPQKQAGGIAGAVAELLRRKVDIIVAPYESTVKSAIAATATVPIVMIAVDYDPLALGYIKSLSRPGGNVTGLFLQQPELAKKRLQLLTEALPGVQTATMFWDSSSEDQWKATSSAAAELGLRLAGVELREQPYDYEKLWRRHHLIIAAFLLPQCQRDFIATDSAWRTSLFGKRSHPCLPCANGSMRVACFPTA